MSIDFVVAVPLHYSCNYEQVVNPVKNLNHLNTSTSSFNIEISTMALLIF